MTLWPSNQVEWDALAAKIQAARVADVITAMHRDDIEEPLSPEEEETFF